MSHHSINNSRRAACIIYPQRLKGGSIFINSNFKPDTPIKWSWNQCVFSEGKCTQWMVRNGGEPSLLRSRDWRTQWKKRKQETDLRPIDWKLLKCWQWRPKHQWLGKNANQEGSFSVSLLEMSPMTLFIYAVLQESRHHRALSSVKECQPTWACYMIYGRPWMRGDMGHQKLQDSDTAKFEGTINDELAGKISRIICFMSPLSVRKSTDTHGHL